MMPETTMSIREMCDGFGVTPRTLRFYERKELLSPIRVRQRRLFMHRDRVRMELILRGKRFGFSLEGIRHLYDVGDTQVVQYTRAVEMGRLRLQDMIEQRDELNSAIEDLLSIQLTRFEAALRPHVDQQKMTH